MPAKCARFGAALTLKPCELTQRRRRTPMAEILAWLPGPDLPPHPDTDPAVERLGLHAELGQRLDDQRLQRRHVGAHVAEAAADVEHDIADALAGAMVGELAAAAGAVHGKAGGVEEVALPGAGAGGVERRVLEEPDQLARGAGGDRLDAGGHDGGGRLVGHEPGRDEPFDGRVGAHVHAANVAEAWGRAPGAAGGVTGRARDSLTPSRNAIEGEGQSAGGGVA